MRLPHLWCVIPVYNEEHNIPALLRSAGELSKRVDGEFNPTFVLVDDGSGDGTVAAIRRESGNLDVQVIQLPRNRGPGAAFAEGLAFVGQRIGEYDWALTMEGDNTSSPETILHMLTRRKEGYDVVMGSPYLHGGRFSRVSMFRRAISHAGNALCKLVFGLGGFVTFSCFLRLYSAETIRRLQAAYGHPVIVSNGFECMVELLVKLVAIGSRISEVEMRVDWSRRTGQSKMRVLRTVMGYLRLLLNRRNLMRYKPLPGVIRS